MTTPVFDANKSLQAVLYVVNRLKRRDFHKIFKVLYFADRAHLIKYGRPITGDTYIAMEYGPVPSMIYDIFKGVRGDGYQWPQIEEFKKLFQVKNRYNIEPLKDADLYFLSKTDVAELDSSLSEYGELSWDEIIDKSHAFAWANTPLNDRMSLEDIMQESRADDRFIAEVTENIRAAKELNR